MNVLKGVIGLIYWIVMGIVVLLFSIIWLLLNPIERLIRKFGNSWSYKLIRWVRIGILWVVTSLIDVSKILLTKQSINSKSNINYGKS